MLTGAVIAIGTLVEMILLSLVFTPISLYLDIRVGIILAAAFLSLFAIGAANYFLYMRFLCRRADDKESVEKSWHSPRRRRDRGWGKRISVWISIVTVGILFLYLPEALGLVTHLFRPGPAKLIGLDVRLPLPWMVLYEPSSSDEDWSQASALECKGLARSGLNRYWHLQPRISDMSFRSTRLGHWSPPERLRGETLSLRTVAVGNESVRCREFAHYTDAVGVDCRSTDGTFSASFYGDKYSVDVFYRTLQRVRASTSSH